MLKMTAAIAVLALSTGALAQTMTPGTTNTGSDTRVTSDADQSAMNASDMAGKPMKAKSQKTMAKKPATTKKTAKKSM